MILSCEFLSGMMITIDCIITIKEKAKLKANIINADQVDFTKDGTKSVKESGITFIDGKPSTNIAKSVEVTVQAVI